MPIILPFANHVPRIDPCAWIADNAVVIGDVEIASGATIWFGAVLRGDVGPIRIGARSNYKTCVACTPPAGSPRSRGLGEDVTVGHHCVLHGCQIGNRALVGMGEHCWTTLCLEKTLCSAPGGLLHPTDRDPRAHAGDGASGEGGP